MSDLFAIRVASSPDSEVLFGMNINGVPNEGQSILRIPAQKDPQWKVVEATFMELPQHTHTYEVLLSKAKQYWGAHMGLNEKGVCIGVTATRTKVKLPATDSGLTAYDLLRLALERSDSAKAAVKEITELSQQFGVNPLMHFAGKQERSSFSFLITDRKHIYVLEFVGAEWAYQEIKADVAVLSGEMVLEEDLHGQSEGLKQWALDKRWYKEDKPFNFHQVFGKAGVLSKHKKGKRQLLIEKALDNLQGDYTVKGLMELLSSHKKVGKKFKPSSSTDKDLCKHANKNTPWQTNNSVVVNIRQKVEDNVCWFTGTSTPSMSLYKPFFIPGDNIYEGLFKEATLLKNDSLWWRHESFQRLVSLNFKRNRPGFEQERVEIQERLLQTEELFRIEKADSYMRNKLSEDSLKIHMKKILEWEFEIKKHYRSLGQFTPVYKGYVKQLNQEVTAAIE
ncbi:C69 family dipeptidase [Algivirga pacifica]|uniref:Dipeptidase n=1 Tax=Algivirga pacifica TaxID=1162670 RepID=A0ABP9DLG6_9BACT